MKFNYPVITIFFAFVLSLMPAEKIAHSTGECVKYYVFVIDEKYRSDKKHIEDPGKWRCIGDFADSIPSCAPDKLQACQLVVDERDTDSGDQSLLPRKLKSTVSITAFSSNVDNLWYVNRYIPSGNYLYKIVNEENFVKF